MSSRPAILWMSRLRSHSSITVAPRLAPRPGGLAASLAGPSPSLPQPARSESGLCHFLAVGLCSFPTAAITNCYKFRGLQQQKFISSQFRRPEIRSPGAGELPSKALLLAVPSFWWWLALPVATSLTSLPLSSLSLKRTFVIKVRAHLRNPG